MPFDERPALKSLIVSLSVEAPCFISELVLFFFFLDGYSQSKLLCYSDSLQTKQVTQNKKYSNLFQVSICICNNL